VRWPALLCALLAAGADTAYVSDELVLGVYAEQNGQGQRLTTLHSGTSVETLAQSGEFTQVRLSDGTLGWVKSAFLTSKEPAIVRVKQLEEELERNRANPPALKEAAALSEVERLKQELNAKQAEIDAARGQQRPTAVPAAAAPLRTAPAAGIAAGAFIGLLCGFWLGYATLARRVKHKFGGIKVY
jgi:SH3-like domain-containing protein